MPQQGGLDLRQLDADAPDLDLQVVPAQELEAPVGQAPPPVSRPVEPRAVLAGGLPAIDVIRDDLGLTGTKQSCDKKGQCGTCMVLVDGKSVLSCTQKVEALDGAEITTIEGLSEDGSHPVQVAWRDLDVAQCRYCQCGQIMQAASLLKEKPHPSDTDIEDAMSGNLCRCGTYTRIRAAIKQAAAQSGGAA